MGSRPTRAIFKRARARREARQAEAIRKVVCAEFAEHGGGGGYGDTSSNYERGNGWDWDNGERRAPIGFQLPTKPFGL